MSRVFVAEELALGRLVVIKLLPPEMAAAISTERFKREIQLVAALQHPHIVPVLSAGTVDGLLYYTMPFVDGLSLRDRLQREGALPIDDAISIIREVAGALAYAHGKGLIHRDIKPENVLLSQGHALVTDFGIAKALTPDSAASVPEISTGEMLTAVGTSIGTPQYMSPEQGVGDPTTDSRSDIYSLGIMAYELLSGTTPFADRLSPHTLLMAHMVETPISLRDKRPEIPVDVAALIMRCIAKEPKNRPSTAGEVVQQLSGMHSLPSTLRSETPSKQGTRWPVYAAASVVLLVALTVVWRGVRTPDANEARSSAAGISESSMHGDDADRITVTTFANETGNPSLDGIGRIAADWLTTALAGTGLVKVIDARAALGTDSVKADASSAIKTAREIGAGTVVTGSYFIVGDSLQFDVKLLNVNTAEVIEALESVKGPAADPTATIELVRQRTLGALASRLNPQLSELARATSQPPTYAAYQQLVAGMDAFFAGKTEDARGRFIRASQIDTGSVLTRTWLLESLEALGELKTADSVARQLERRRERLSPLENAQLDEYISSIRRQPAANLDATFRLHQLAPNGQFRATLSRKLLLANRWQEALDTLVAAPAEVGIFKGKAYPLEQKLTLLHGLDRHEEEIATSQELERRFPSPRREFDEARAYAAAGKADTLQTMAAQIEAQSGGRISARAVSVALADELLWHGHNNSSDAMLRALLASFDAMPADSAKLPAAVRGRAETLARLGRWKDAYDAIMPMVSADTTLATRMSLAVLAAHAGYPTPALTIEKSLANKNTDLYNEGSVSFLRARLTLARGEEAAAVNQLRLAQNQAFPVNSAVHANLEFSGLIGDPAFVALFRR